jgi:prolipoprotein diacylglyceryl transferase
MNDYFVWDIDPVMFTLGPFDLPFSISIPAFVIAVIAAIGLKSLGGGETTSTVDTDELSRSERRRRRREQADSQKKETILDKISDFPGWALFLGIFVIGQLIFSTSRFPSLDQIGPIAPRYYGLMFALAFLVGYQLARHMFITKGGFTQQQLDSLLMHMIVATVIGARLGHVIFYDPGYYFSNPVEILKIWEGGLASHGTAIGILIGLYLFQKKNPDAHFLWITDRVVITVAIGGAFIRIGNFFNSEILGQVSDVSWAIIFASRGPAPHHPSMLYESIWYISLFIILWMMYKKLDSNPPKGLIFSVFLVYMFTGRFLIEFTKARQAAFSGDWTISVGQWLSVPFVLLGCWIYYNYVHKRVKA